MGEEEFASVVEGRFRKRVDEVNAPSPNKPSMISLLTDVTTGRLLSLVFAQLPAFQLLVTEVPSMQTKNALALEWLLRTCLSAERPIGAVLCRMICLKLLLFLSLCCM